METEAWGWENEEGRMGMGLWRQECGAIFFWLSVVNFLSNDLISHIAMEEWEWCIYLVGSHL